jgi:tetratricopeptide (TPR) repeat protein
VTAPFDSLYRASPSVRDVGIAVAVAMLPIILYWPVRHHAFVSYDDIVYIVENPQLRGALDWGRVWQAFSTPYESNWIPLTWLSLHLDVLWYGFEPAGHHLTNVGLHAASSAFLFLALTRLSRARGPSAFVALVFAVHPLHVESVAWATERKDTLSGLFWMLSMWAYANHVQAPAGRGRRLWYLALLVCFALGLLAKPVVVTLPFALLLLDYWPARRLRRDAKLGWPERAPLIRALIEKLPLMALALAASVITLAVQRESGAMSHGDLLPLSVRLTTALDAYRWYAFASFWPTELAVFYPHLLTVPKHWWIGGILLLVSSGVALRLATSRPQLLVGFLWFAITLVPVIGIVQTGMQARADRYMYLPLIGVTIMVAWVRLPRWLGLALGLLAIVMLSFVTRTQLHHWRDSRALYQRAIDVTAGNFLARNGLAVELIETGDFDAAEVHLREAIRLKPGWPDPQVTFGDLLATRGDPEGAIGHYQAALRLAPDHARAHANLGSTLIDLGRGAEAIEHLRHAQRAQRNVGFAHLHGLLGQALAQSGALEQAVSEYEQALAVRPAWGEAAANLGFVLLRMNEPARALVFLNNAQRNGLHTLEVEFGLGQATSELGRLGEAIEHYRSALKLSPGWRPATNNLAWLLATRVGATRAEGEQAVALAQPLVSDAEGAADLLDTLAAAHATAGQFELAIRVAEQAVARAKHDQNPLLAEEIRRRLQDYRSGRAYVDQPKRP